MAGIDQIIVFQVLTCLTVQQRWSHF